MWFITGARRGMVVDIAKAALAACNAVTVMDMQEQINAYRDLSTARAWPGTPIPLIRPGSCRPAAAGYSVRATRSRRFGRGRDLVPAGQEALVRSHGDDRDDAYHHLGATRRQGRRLDGDQR